MTNQEPTVLNFTDTASRDAFLDLLPDRVGSEDNVPGLTHLPDGRSVGVFCERVTIYPSPYCRSCGKPEDECTGSGMDDGIQAHDFQPGGVEAPGLEDDDLDEESLYELVHSAASTDASNALNAGDGVEFLLAQGFTLDEIREGCGAGSEGRKTTGETREATG